MSYFKAKKKFGGYIKREIVSIFIFSGAIQFIFKVFFGTAFDIAGTGKASPVSFIEAVEVAKKHS